MKLILLAILDFYRYWLSPIVHSLFPSGCRYQPTCSQYATDAIALHGAGRGGWMALQRLLRCHPFGSSGFDPVPLSGKCAKPGALQAAVPAANPSTYPDPLP